MSESFDRSLPGYKPMQLYKETGRPCTPELQRYLEKLGRPIVLAEEKLVPTETPFLTSGGEAQKQFPTVFPITPEEPNYAAIANWLLSW